MLNGQLDAIDWRILGLLQGDARISKVELALSNARPAAR